MNAATHARPAVVIFGATGDLSLRMLYPSLYFLDADGLLPEGLRFVGAVRSAISTEAFLVKVREAVCERAGEHCAEEAWARFEKRLGYVAAAASRPESFEALQQELAGSSQSVFYLST